MKKLLITAIALLAVVNQAYADEVGMTVKLENKNYIVTVDGAKCPPVASSSLTSKEKVYPCNDNYQLKAKTYTGFFGGIYAYFEAIHHGSNDVLAYAELKIGTREPSQSYREAEALRSRYKQPGEY